MRLGFNVPEGETAIVPIAIEESKDMIMWKGLYDRNIFVNVFVAPSTPAGEGIIHNNVMATQKQNYLDYLVET